MGSKNKDSVLTPASLHSLPSCPPLWPKRRSSSSALSQSEQRSACFPASSPTLLAPPETRVVAPPSVYWLGNPGEQFKKKLQPQNTSGQRYCLTKQRGLVGQKGCLDTNFFCLIQSHTDDKISIMYLFPCSFVLVQANPCNCVRKK